MSFRHQLLEQHVDAAPGDVVPIRVELHNDATVEARFTLRVVGLDDRITSAGSGGLQVAVGPGESAICSVPVSVPGSLGTGQHAAAMQVASSAADTRPVLTQFTVAISSLAGLEIVPTPSPIRGKRRASFHVDVVNHEPDPVEFTLSAEANDVRVTFDRSTFLLEPGQRDVTAAKLKASPLRRGEPIQHNVLLTARGRASSASTTVPYVQRPLFAHTARAALAALVLIGLWVGAIVGVFAWLNQREQAAERAAAEQITGVDTDGDGVADVFYDETGLVVAAPEAIDRDGDGDPDGHVDADGDPIPVVTALDTDGDGIADTFVDAAGEPVVDPSTGADGSGDPDEIASTATPEPDAVPASAFRPTVTTFGGTVAADGESVEDIRIVVSPITLGSDGAGAATAFAGDQAGRTGKIWSARRAIVPDGDLVIRQSEAIEPREIAPGVDGLWRIGDVPLGRSYEVAFSKVGFDTQRFVLTPPDDGEPVELDVELEPATGLISGRVVGPSGPLGGADIRITDGTLLFETTADTDGDIGSFVIERVSTPGVYTITATLRGFGTEVVQVELDAGEQAGGVEIVMSSGVATVTGRVVDEFGRPLPGASVSATNGANTRRTTSLTAGDVGSYALPQLDVPSDYTIDVSLDGYSSQTRRVPIGGSVAGINFVLARTTSTVSGTVTSAGGGGVVAAGVTLTNGDLEFRTSTTNAPNGFFSVSDLPAGNYTVTVEHFEHQASTQFVTVTEGLDPAPLSIVLPLLGDSENVGTGELVVEVVDPDAENADERPVPATISLTETRTGRVVPTPTTPASTVRIQNIAPGTYTLTASASGYADSAPRQVSIGLQSERREVEVRRLGQAGGRMIDSLTQQPVGPFALELFFTIGNQTVDTGLRVLGGADGTWSTEPRALAPGEYVVRIRDAGAPAGYRVLEDQLLDPDASGLMRFTVVGGLDEPNEVLDIEADPFPDLEGRIFTPNLIANDTITDLVPIDDGSLTATLSCAGNTATVEAALEDRVGVVGPDAAPLYDTYVITKEQIDADRLVGACQILVRADGFVDATISLPNLQPSDGINENDRIANAALHSPSQAIGGTIFWEDPRFVGVPVLLDDVDIATNAIVEFPPTDEPPPPPGNEPDVRRADLSTKSVGGAWVLAGQVFGPADYQITEEGFAPTTFQAIIDETRTRRVTASTDITMSPVSPSNDPVDANVSYDLRLDDPFDGQVVGQVNILTSATTPDYADVVITATDPESNPVTIPRIERPTIDDGTFRIDAAQAGTWDVDFGLPDNHILHTPVAAALRATDRVDPGEAQAGFDTTLVDLATIAVSVSDLGTSTAVTNAIDIAIAPTGSGGAPGGLTGVAAPATLGGVRVDIADPVNRPISYSLDLNIPGYDPATAIIDITSGTSTSRVTGRFTNIPVSVVAGRDVDIAVQALPFGEILGEIFGAVDRRSPSPTLVPLDVTSPTGSGRAEIRIAQMSSDGSTVIDPDVTDTMLVEPHGAPGGFRVSGPSGVYRFSVSHPEFEAPDQTPTNSPGTRFLPLGVFELRSTPPNDLSGIYRLPIRLADVNIDVFEELAADPRVPVADYSVSMQFQGDLTEPPYSASPQNNTQLVPGLIPGMYELTISAPGRFSFIADVLVRRTELGNPIVTTIVAPLPAAGAILDGEVRAQNSLMQPVALPSVTVTRTFNGELGSVSDGVAPDPDEAAINTTPAVEQKTVSDPGGTATFFLDANVALGTHTVSVTGSPGYSTPDDQVVVVTDLGPTRTDISGPFVLTVDNVDVVVGIVADNSGEFTNLAAELNGPAGPFTGEIGGDATNATATFRDVPPSLTAYTLTVSDPLYDDVSGDGQDFSITVPVNTGGTATVPSDPASVSPQGQRGVASGTITQDGDPIVVTTDTSIQLTPTGGGTAIPITPTNGAYELTVAPGTYDLSVENGLRFTRVSQQITIEGGVRTVTDLDIEQLAKVTVTTTPTPLPNGVVVELQQRGGGRIQPNPANSLDFYVERGERYQVVVFGTYPETFFPAGNSTFQVGPNATDVTRPITLPRRVEVTTNNFPAGLDIQVGAQTQPASAVPVLFTSPDIAATGTLTVNLRTGNGAADVILTTTVPDELSTILEFDFVDLTGDLTVSDGVTIPVGTAIAASSGTTMLTGEVTAGNRYLIEGLTRNANNSARTWTLQFSADGYGTIDTVTSISIAQGSPAARDLPATVTPREFTVTFDVDGLAANAVTGTLIDFNGVTDSANTVFSGVRETQGTLNYTVSIPNGSLQDAGGMIDTSLRDGSVDVDMVQADLSGTVGSLTGFGPTTVRICAGTNADGACTPVAGMSTFPITGTSGTFTRAPLTTPGAYYVEVRRVTTEADAGNGIAEVTSERFLPFSVESNGSVTVGTVSNQEGTTSWTITLFGEP